MCSLSGRKTALLRTLNIWHALFVCGKDLNADDSLYRALCGVVNEEGAMDGFTGEQRRVVGLHMAEFERGGIHLSGEER